MTTRRMAGFARGFDLKTVEEGVAESMRRWAEHFNCAESVLRGVCHAQGLSLDETSLRMATPFGGGVGRAEDLCGALSGGVLAIGANIGRTRADEDRLRSYDAAGELHKRFLDRFGSTSCKALNKSDFKSSEHRVRCGKFVEECSRFTIEILRKN